MKKIAPALLGALMFVSAGPCQDEVRAIGRKFVLEPGSYELPTLVDRVASYLNYNILCDTNQLASSGSIRLGRRTVVDEKGCWELFGSLLYHKGFAILALDAKTGLYEVIAISGPRNQEITNGAQFVPHDEVEAYANQRATPILTSVPLQNINATVATNALRPFFASSGRGNSGITLGNVGNNTDMLLQGFGPQVAAACRLLRLVDVGDTGISPKTVVVHLEHARAEDLAARVVDMFGTHARQAQMQAGMPMGIPLRVVAHPALNAVLLSGNAGQIRDAMALMDRLDLPSATTNEAIEEFGDRLERLEKRLQSLEKALRSGR